MELDKHLRDTLALDRTRMANQRTFLSFLRTSVYFSAMGLTVIGVDDFEAIQQLSIPLFVVSGILFLTGIVSYFREKRKIRKVQQRLSQLTQTA